MKIIYGKPQQGGGNFGDDMNIYLWPALFGQQIFQQDDSTSFLGIGTMLSDDIVYNREWWNTQKVVFGTGVRSNSRHIEIDDSYNLIFLRGPLSKAFLGTGKYVTDAAYCFALTHYYDECLQVEKKHKVGLMPYFRSMNLVDWERIAQTTGMHLISPCTDEHRSALDIVREIASCETLVTEAMHGAIFADILRIRWSRFNFSTYLFEQANVADFKWMDWMYSMDMKHFDYPRIQTTCKINHAFPKLTGGLFNFNYLFRNTIAQKIERTLKDFAYDWQLSDEQVFALKLSELKTCVDSFKTTYLC